MSAHEVPVAEAMRLEINLVDRFAGCGAALLGISLDRFH